MKRALIVVLRALGLMPLAYRLRTAARVVVPKSLAMNVRFWLGGEREALPVPRLKARLLVSGSSNIPEFLEAGRRGFECIRDALERHGTPLSSVKDVLDFGCGCGRVLRYWQGHPDKRLCGTDTSDYLVEECGRCAPFAEIGRNPMLGRTRYADGSFDLLYAFSVFTHLDLAAQQAWLDEFHRIVRPGGFVFLSVHGRAFRPRLTERERAAFDAGQPVVRFGQYLGANLCSAFHPEAYARQAMTRGFEIVELAPEGAKGNLPQDLYVLRRL